MTKTYADTVQWIKDHEKQFTEGMGDADERALWFFACREADYVHTEMDMKDVAFLFLNGVPKLTPEVIDHDLSVQIDFDVTPDRLEDELEEHFGFFSKCNRCGARYKEDPSCGKMIHESLPNRPA